MEVSFKGRHVDIGDALKEHAESSLQNHVKKYFAHALDANVVFSKEGHGFRADISVHAGRGMVMQGGGDAGDAYSAFDNALNRIAKQLRRYKRRLRSHHKGPDTEETVLAQQYVIAPENEDREAEADDQPVVIAEMPHQIATLTVGEAVMRMDLADAPVIMFRNRANGGLNVVYRRTDGNVGWIDPSSTQQNQG